jgi:hypothetical protein
MVGIDSGVLRKIRHKYRLYRGYKRYYYDKHTTDTQYYVHTIDAVRGGEGGGGIYTCLLASDGGGGNALYPPSFTGEVR